MGACHSAESQPGLGAPRRCTNGLNWVCCASFFKEHAMNTYAEFWPFYLREHSKPSTRAMHYAGSFVALSFVVAAVVTGHPALMLGALFSGYGFAWVAHFFIEHNRPATFRCPFYSFASDWKMWAYWLTGRLGPELEKAGVNAVPARAA
jgi:hypothetical protein